MATNRGIAVISGSYTLTVKVDPFNPLCDLVVPLTAEIADLYAMARACSPDGKVRAIVQPTSTDHRTGARYAELIHFE